jgi:hypothetical protein
MNRRVFLMLGAASAAMSAASADRARAWKLLTSTVTVNVVAVERLSSDLVHLRGGQSRETTTFLAKAEVANVIATEHGLSPGAVIDIRYDVVVPRPPSQPEPKLTAGDAKTLTLMGNGNSFEWMFWVRPDQ